MSKQPQVQLRLAGQDRLLAVIETPTSEKAPSVDVVMMVDVSGSMTSAMPLVRALCSAVHQSVNSLQLWTFNSSVTRVDLSDSLAISRIRASGSTNTVDASLCVLSEIKKKKASGRNLVGIVVTDGDPTSGKATTTEDIVAECAKAKLPESDWRLLYCGVGSNLRVEDAAAVARGMHSDATFQLVKAMEEIPEIIGHMFGEGVMLRDPGYEKKDLAGCCRLPTPLMCGQTIYAAFDGNAASSALTVGDVTANVAPGDAIQREDRLRWVKCRVADLLPGDVGAALKLLREFPVELGDLARTVRSARGDAGAIRCARSLAMPVLLSQATADAGRAMKRSFQRSCSEQNSRGSKKGKKDQQVNV